MERQRRYLDQKLSKIKASYAVVSQKTDVGVRLQSPISEEDLDTHSWVLDDACARLGWSASHALIDDARANGYLRIQDSQLSLYCQGKGELLIADADFVFNDSDKAVLRVKLHRITSGQDVVPNNCVGEYTIQGIWLGDVAEVIKEVADARQQMLAEVESKPKAGTKQTAKVLAMEDKKRRIFEGACEIIGREGYAATTIRKVAKAAGVPISTMYQYIETKEDLLFMITNGCMEEIFEYMTVEMSSDHPPEQKLEEAVTAYLKYISKNRRYINLVYRETRALNRSNRERIFDIERQFTQLWEAIIIEGNEAGVFKTPKTRLAANMIYFFCNVWSLRYWSIQDYTEDEVKEYLLKFIRSGLN